jgi:hypothetical protein
MRRRADAADRHAGRLLQSAGPVVPERIVDRQFKPAALRADDRQWHRASPRWRSRCCSAI